MKRKVDTLLEKLNEEEYYRMLIEREKRRREHKKRLMLFIARLFHYTGFHAGQAWKEVVVDDKCYKIWRCAVCQKPLVEKDMEDTPAMVGFVALSVLLSSLLCGITWLAIPSTLIFGYYLASIFTTLWIASYREEEDI